MVKVKFVKQGNIYKCLSNFIDKDVDLLELLVLDLDTQQKIRDFKDAVFFRLKNYSMLTVDIKIDKNKIIIIENFPFEENYIASKAIDKGILKKIINDWSMFLKNKKEFEKEYYL